MASLSLQHIYKIYTGGVTAVSDFTLNIEDKEFIGYIDEISRSEGKIIITDNKSRNLKPRSKRSKPTASDKELDKYLKQLYIYSVPIECTYNELPSELRFNCFRTQTLISEPFNKTDYTNTKKWAIKTIENISKEQNWKPNIELFKCRHICDVHSECEYFNMYES